MRKIIVKIKKGKYTDADTVRDTIRYITKKAEHNSISSANVSANPENCIKQMMQNKIYFGKSDGKQIVHMVVACKDFKELSVNGMVRLSAAIVRYFKGKYQIIYATHNKDEDSDFDKRHIHFIINTVSITGKRFHMSKAELFELKNHVYKVADQILASCDSRKRKIHVFNCSNYSDLSEFLRKIAGDNSIKYY